MNDNDEWKGLMRQQQKRRVIEPLKVYAVMFVAAASVIFCAFAFAFSMVKLMEWAL